jgi:hypothetical protein
VPTRVLRKPMPLQPSSAAIASPTGHMTNFRCCLPSCGAAARPLDELAARLDDPDPAVRCWVGAHALSFAPERAVAVLEALASAGRGPVRLAAEETLVEWRAGRLAL